MLVSIYLQQSNFGANMNLLTTKMQQMEQEFGHFFQYDKEIYDQSIRVSNAVSY